MIGNTKSKKPASRKLSDRDDDPLMSIISNEKPPIVKLCTYLELELVPEEYQSEFLYSELLEDIVLLTNRILSDKGNWRI